MVVALADLASRFPNVLEPWTGCIYKTLEDPEPAVKLAALSSLTHLVLGGMVKAKGNVAKVAALLVDDEQEIAERAVLFFESLAKTGSGSSTRAASAAAGASAANPVYNLLPDCLSKLLEDKKLREEQLQAILAVLLGYVKDKQAESLKERLVGRLALGGPREWRTVAWCIAQLGYSEKGMRRIMELTPSYRHALAERQVFDVFMCLAEKARRSSGGAKAAAAAAVPDSGSQLGGITGDLRSAVEEWVADLLASRQAAVEAAEVEAAEEARRQQQQQQHQHQQGDADAAGEVGEGAAGGADADGDSMETDAAASGQTTAAAAGEVALDDADLNDEGVAADDAVAEDDCEAAEQIVLLQSQDMAAELEEEAEEAAEAAAAARLRQQQVEARLQRLSITNGSGSARTSSSGAARGAAATRSGRSSAAAPGAVTAAKRKPGAARAARLGSKAPAAKESESGSSSSSYESSNEDAGGGSSSSSSSGEDDTAAADKRQQPAAAASRGKVVGAGNRRGAAAAAAAVSGAVKPVSRRRSAATQAQQARFVDFSGSEDDD
ncbi:non-SMC mitotic condensation complex subunit 1-domain-containing protein [Scenedesmus sp. NREL 46B-D3]|nr:non-SMC mitotic condensation complex subunit 1-domain-containing protein [Scenedesmus sp. NREL 46B-D3]